MKYTNILELSRKVFSNYSVIDSKETRYNKAIGNISDKVTIKRFSNKLKKEVFFAEIGNKLLGTTFLDEVWELRYKVNDTIFEFLLESGSELEIMEITLNWYVEAKKAEDLRNLYQRRYSEIKKNVKLEVRNHKLEKLLL